MLTAILMCASGIVQDPAPGIERGLATARAERVRDVRYELRFTLGPGATEVTGEVLLLFRLAEDQPTEPLVLDFDGSDLTEPQVNGRNVGESARRVANHLVLDPGLLLGGNNVFTARFRSAVAPSGTPLTYYRDPGDGREFFYTLVVPADAHRLYPCFDQPDIKAVFAIELDLPDGWLAVANAPLRQDSGAIVDGRCRWRFADSKPLPTYLAAFACGQFHRELGPPLQVPGVVDPRPMQIFVRPSQRPLLDAKVLFDLHGSGLRWLSSYFGVDYPFGKLDVVLLPGFPYGGMEHAGAIFYREQAMLFDHPPTDGELVRRSTLVYHELAHQWFGNLVTMRWFDDLWLKEGFATFVAYLAMAELEPERRSWLRFGQRIKPRAYEVDVTPGTTPIYQDLQNLADAKSAYGAVVYNKAPAVLRELHERLGSAAFRAGLQRFLERFSFGNATWRDLAAALENAGRVDLGRWSSRWLLAPSLPLVRVQWTEDERGEVDSATLLQQPLAGTDSWPLQIELLVIEPDGGRSTIAVTSDAPRTEIREMLGRPGPACVLANPRDIAYCQFVPDGRSRTWLCEHVGDEPDLLLRAMMAAALFAAVREAELDPVTWSTIALRLLLQETDPDTHSWLLDTLATCLDRYLVADRAEPLRQAASEQLLRQLGEGRAPGMELQSFRFLAWHGAGAAVQELCRAVASFEQLPAGLQPGRQDRFLAAAALLAGGGPDLIDQLQRRFEGDDVAKEAFLARAATPTEASKAAYWQLYLQLAQPPEQWVQDSLPYFHWRGQRDVTMPYLRPALERVDWVKRHRRIFFMPAWIDGFVNGSAEAAALAIVDDFLAETHLDPDIRSKVLQSRDALHRAVRIQAAFSVR